MNLRLLQDSKLSPNPTLKVKATTRHSQPSANRVKGLATTELVTPPEGATTETWYTVAGSFYVGTESGLADYTAAVPTINVAFDGDNELSTFQFKVQRSKRMTQNDRDGTDFFGN